MTETLENVISPIGGRVSPTNEDWLYTLNEKRSGATNAELLAGLTARGVNTSTANIMISSIRKMVLALRKKTYRQIAWGGFLFVVGCFITFGSYASAAQGGGRYLIMYGPILFGGARSVRALVDLKKYQDILDQTDAGHVPAL
jgi:hypothetical protein